jgi:hypothetical protein
MINVTGVSETKTRLREPGQAPDREGGRYRTASGSERDKNASYATSPTSPSPKFSRELSPYPGRYRSRFCNNAVCNEPLLQRGVDFHAEGVKFNNQGSAPGSMLLGRNVKQILQNECLMLRNACGHPNSASIAENGVAAHHIEKIDLQRIL